MLIIALVDSVKSASGKIDLSKLVFDSTSQLVIYAVLVEVE
jgi:hypothetical protein